MHSRKLYLILSWTAVALTAPVFAQMPDEPPKPDIPYLIHASSLMETEPSEASEVTEKKKLFYTVPGAASAVKTPLAGPEFLFKSETIDPNDFQLFSFVSKGGRRELLFRNKKKFVAQPHRLSVFPLKSGAVRIRVDETLDLGEYCLTPDGSNAVFCFAVY